MAKEMRSSKRPCFRPTENTAAEYTSQAVVSTTASICNLHILWLDGDELEGEGGEV